MRPHLSDHGNYSLPKRHWLEIESQEWAARFGGVEQSIVFRKLLKAWSATTSPKGRVSLLERKSYLGSPLGREDVWFLTLDPERGHGDLEISLVQPRGPHDDGVDDFGVYPRDSRQQVAQVCSVEVEWVDFGVGSRVLGRDALEGEPLNLPGELLHGELLRPGDAAKASCSVCVYGSCC
jgi:hypothetical protein